MGTASAATSSTSSGSLTRRQSRGIGATVEGPRSAARDARATLALRGVVRSLEDGEGGAPFDPPFAARRADVTTAGETVAVDDGLAASAKATALGELWCAGLATTNLGDDLILSLADAATKAFGDDAGRAGAQLVATTSKCTPSRSTSAMMSSALTTPHLQPLAQPVSSWPRPWIACLGFTRKPGLLGLPRIHRKARIHRNSSSIRGRSSDVLRAIRIPLHRKPRILRQ
jgi:hypothetical protein